jgi:prepilin-type N-terminal cleavage/methylation domain-containing protein
MTNLRKQNTAGFTLVEVVIVVAIFSVIITMTAGLFVAALRAERQVLETKKVLGEASYALEYMTRVLRMAKRNDDGICPFNIEYNYDVPPSENEIMFINALQGDECQSFFLDTVEKQIKIKVHGTGLSTPLTSSTIMIENLKFEISGEWKEDEFQPFVTIYFEAKTEKSSPVQVQTSVSQRNLDVK